MKEVKTDKDRIYVFGDNIKDLEDEYVPTMTQAVIRMLDNAYVIMTKRDRRKNPSSYFNDSQFEEFKENLEMAISDLKSRSSKGKEIVFPNGGLGTGKES